MTATLIALYPILMVMAVRARFERREMWAWDEREAIAAAADMRALKTVMYPDAESLKDREIRHYINRLDAATNTRPIILAPAGGCEPATPPRGRTTTPAGATNDKDENDD